MLFRLRAFPKQYTAQAAESWGLIKLRCKRTELIAEGAAVILGRKLKRKQKMQRGKAYILSINSAKLLGDS